MISVLEMFVFIIGSCHCAGSQVLLLNCAFPNYCNFSHGLLIEWSPNCSYLLCSTLIFYTMITAVLMGNRNSEHLIIRDA